MRKTRRVDERRAGKEAIWKAGGRYESKVWLNNLNNFPSHRPQTKWKMEKEEIKWRHIARNTNEIMILMVTGSDSKYFIKLRLNVVGKHIFEGKCENHKMPTSCHEKFHSLFNGDSQMEAGGIRSIVRNWFQLKRIDGLRYELVAIFIDFVGSSGKYWELFCHFPSINFPSCVLESFNASTRLTTFSLMKHKSIEKPQHLIIK